jgi:hypothetical protein
MILLFSLKQTQLCLFKYKLFKLCDEEDPGIVIVIEVESKS